MQRHTRAFTLIELIVTIAIIALLVSILIPSLSSARRSAKANACLSHLKGVGSGFSVYLVENEDQFPPHRLGRVPPASMNVFVNDFRRRQPRWQWFIKTDFGPVINPTPFQGRMIDPLGYFHDQESVLGPAIAKQARTMTHDLFTCPALDDEAFDHDIRDGAFGYNYQYLGNARQDRSPGRWDHFSVGLHRIRNAGSTVLVADSRGADRKHGKHSYMLDPPRLAEEVNAKRFGPVSGNDLLDPVEPYVPPGLDPAVYAYSPAEARHNDRVNIVFVDSHAESMTLKKLGYQLSEGDSATRLLAGTPLPVTQLSGTQATNRLFNGEGTDLFVREANNGGTTPP